VRYVPYNGSGTIPLWALKPTTRRRICISLGRSLGEHNPAIIRTAIAAASVVRDAEVMFAATAGTLRHLGELPDNVRFLDSVPLRFVLPSCDLLLSHGGAGTGLTACALGVPQLVVPQMADQFEFGRNLAKQGAGVHLSTAEEQGDVEYVRSVLTDILADSAYRTAAAELRAEMEAMPLPGTLVPVLSPNPPIGFGVDLWQC
jgi:UDP:flavonoid glycosyltransferase YjiC (YdhE family)